MAPSVSASVRRVRRSDGICDQRAVTVAGISPALQRPTATAALYNSFAKTKVASLRRTSRTRSPSRSRWMAGTAGFAYTSRVKPVQPRQVSSGKRRRGQQRPEGKKGALFGRRQRAGPRRAARVRVADPADLNGFGLIPSTGLWTAPERHISQGRFGELIRLEANVSSRTPGMPGDLCASFPSLFPPELTPVEDGVAWTPSQQLAHQAVGWLQLLHPQPGVRTGDFTLTAPVASQEVETPWSELPGIPGLGTMAADKTRACMRAGRGEDPGLEPRRGSSRSGHACGGSGAWRGSDPRDPAKFACGGDRCVPWRSSSNRPRSHTNSLCRSDRSGSESLRLRERCSRRSDPSGPTRDSRPWGGQGQPVAENPQERGPGNAVTVARLEGQVVSAGAAGVVPITIPVSEPAVRSRGRPQRWNRIGRCPCAGMRSKNGRPGAVHGETTDPGCSPQRGHQAVGASSGIGSDFGEEPQSLNLTSTQFACS